MHLSWLLTTHLLYHLTLVFAIPTPCRYANSPLSAFLPPSHSLLLPRGQHVTPPLCAPLAHRVVQNMDTVVKHSSVSAAVCLRVGVSQRQQLTPDSYQTTSCLPDPLCKSGTYDFNDLSRVLLNATQYNGNASMWDWVGEWQCALLG